MGLRESRRTFVASNAERLARWKGTACRLRVTNELRILTPTPLQAEVRQGAFCKRFLLRPRKEAFPRNPPSVRRLLWRRKQGSS